MGQVPTLAAAATTQYPVCCIYGTTLSFWVAPNGYISFPFFFLLWKELRPFFVTDAGRRCEISRVFQTRHGSVFVTVETKPREPTHAHTWHDDDDDDTERTAT